jgi:hypothetical protein
MLDGLAYLPVDDVPAGMAYIRQNTPDVDGLEDLVSYFDSTYVSGAVRRINSRRNGHITIRLARSPPLFPPPLWNVFDATVNGGCRTNNVCEGWNHAFAGMVGHVHPTLWTLIGCLQKDQAIAATAILQDARGQPPAKRQKRAAIQLQQRLFNICTSLKNGTKTVPETLRAVSRCIR